MIQAVGGDIQSSCSNLLKDGKLGQCESFEEIQIGNERFNIFKGCPQTKTCTLILRGGAEQVIAEVERSLHDAIMIVKRSITHKKLLLVVVPLKWNYRNIYVIIVDKFMGNNN